MNAPARHGPASDSSTAADRAAALWRAPAPGPGDPETDHAAVAPDPFAVGTTSWEQTPPRSPIVRWRPALSAVLILAVAALTWWAVSWLNTPVPPGPVPTAADTADAAGTGPEAAAASDGDGHGDGDDRAAGQDGGPASAAGVGPGAAGTTDADRTVGAGGHDATAAGPRGEVHVHVVGAVERPGVVRLPATARVAEALEAAGGASATAETQRINLAAPLHDGQQVLVPDASMSDEQLANAGTSTSAAAAGPAASAGAHAPSTTGGEGLNAGTAPGTVDLNRATAAELETLPGVGPATAQNIIDHREQVGPFASLDDLDAVTGIGPATLEKLREHVRW